MGEIVSFRRAKKRRAAGGAERQAAANRAKFGRSKAEKSTDDAEKKRRDALLDAAKRET